MGVDPSCCFYSFHGDASPGKFGIQVGNQQFTVRNLTVNNAAIGSFSFMNKLSYTKSIDSCFWHMELG